MSRAEQQLQRAVSEPQPPCFVGSSEPPHSAAGSVSSLTGEAKNHVGCTGNETLPYRTNGSPCKVHDSPWAPYHPSSSQRPSEPSPNLQFGCQAINKTPLGCSSIKSPSYAEYSIRHCRIQQQIDVDLAGIGAGICQDKGDGPIIDARHAYLTRIDQNLQQVLAELSAASRNISAVLSLLDDVHKKRRL